MRVALLARAISSLHGYGGLERHVAAFEKYLRRAGCEVTLYTTPPAPGAPGARQGTVFVPYRILPWPRRRGFVVLDRDTNYLAWSLRVGRRVSSERVFDVVQADGGAGFGYALLKAKESAPLVLHPHGMEEFEGPRAKRALYLPLRTATRFAARRAARVIAPDASMMGAVKRHLGVGDERVALVPNAVDLEELDRRGPGSDLGRFDIDPKVRLLLSVGRLESNKGFSYLARALARARPRLGSGFLWVLVGEGPEREALERAIEREGISGLARLPGRVSDDELHALFERSTLFLHPTLYEGSSMVTLEAMAHRKPIVATRVGGIPDKVSSGENGLVVPPADVDALAAAICEALSASSRLSTWGARSREIVERDFSWSRRVGQLVALYETVVEEALRAKR